MQVVVREPVAGDALQWRRLWAAYTAFYQAEVANDVTDYTWQRILDPLSPIFARVAECDEQVAGFAVALTHPTTWTRASACYLEDLFVDPTVRGHGVGHALIAHLIELGQAHKWARLYWHTQAGNVAARRLYDQFTLADDFVRYRLSLSPDDR